MEYYAASRGTCVQFFLGHLSIYPRLFLQDSFSACDGPKKFGRAVSWREICSHLSGDCRDNWTSLKIQTLTKYAENSLCCCSSMSHVWHYRRCHLLPECRRWTILRNLMQRCRWSLSRSQFSLTSRRLPSDASDSDVGDDDLSSAQGVSSSRTINRFDSDIDFIQIGLCSAIFELGSYFKAFAVS